MAEGLLDTQNHSAAHGGDLAVDLLCRVSGPALHGAWVPLALAMVCQGLLPLLSVPPGVDKERPGLSSSQGALGRPPPPPPTDFDGFFGGRLVDQDASLRRMPGGNADERPLLPLAHLSLAWLRRRPSLPPSPSELLLDWP